ncbi:CaiB/BaiF CoA transferase family protein [Pseudonocardia sp. GCM10023141]|uniref:CaiB/BaiF CoA transferase family protein n=1 Tax=Pseudonocardia sp. GCM10023141 TaxID=3252653 RepID=UPI003620F2D4
MTQVPTVPVGPLPLEGVRVLDLTRVLAGPFATCVLGDLGADVIKIEEHDVGDHVRSLPPFYPGDVSHYFLAVNRNKRSMVIDLKSESGRALVLELASKSDVVIENFRPGVMDRLGMGFAELKRSNPKIILCSISGFGATGLMHAQPSFDLVTQARSGVMSITGDAAGPPMKLGLPMGDLGGGLWGAIAILAALNRRQTDASPQHIDISLLEGLISLLGYLGQLALMQGESPGRVGNSHHTIVPYGVFDVADGHLALALHMGSFWRSFCEAIERADLITDPRFAATGDRRDNREELLGILDPILRGRTRAEWVQLLEEADVPHAPILDVVEALDQAQLKERDAIGMMRHPTAGDVPVVRIPIVYTDQGRPEIRPSPLLGEHTREICRDLLGWDDERIDALSAAGVIAGPRATTANE